jgi:hypothetical protein
MEEYVRLQVGRREPQFDGGVQVLEGPFLPARFEFRRQNPKVSRFEMKLCCSRP